MPALYSEEEVPRSTIEAIVASQPQLSVSDPPVNDRIEHSQNLPSPPEMHATCEPEHSLETRNSEGRRCHHCSTESTTMWRHDLEGNILCNPCGQYLAQHGVHRPQNLLEGHIIRKRNRGPNVPTKPNRLMLTRVKLAARRVQSLRPATHHDRTCQDEKANRLKEWVQTLGHNVAQNNSSSTNDSASHQVYTMSQYNSSNTFTPVNRNTLPERLADNPREPLSRSSNIQGRNATRTLAGTGPAAMDGTTGRSRNGTPNDATNGTADGTANGVTNGNTNSITHGITTVAPNGTTNGTVNGITHAPTNGTLTNGNTLNYTTNTNGTTDGVPNSNPLPPLIPRSNCDPLIGRQIRHNILWSANPGHAYVRSQPSEWNKYPWLACRDLVLMTDEMKPPFDDEDVFRVLKYRYSHIHPEIAHQKRWMGELYRFCKDKEREVREQLIWDERGECTVVNKGMEWFEREGAGIDVVKANLLRDREFAYGAEHDCRADESSMIGTSFDLFEEELDRVASGEYDELRDRFPDASSGLEYRGLGGSSCLCEKS